jgi:hypothetical protein
MRRLIRSSHQAKHLLTALALEEMHSQKRSTMTCSTDPCYGVCISLLDMKMQRSALPRARIGARAPCSSGRYSNYRL